MARTRTLRAGDAGRALHPPPHGGGETGFTLIELIATMTIAALAIVVGGQFWMTGNSPLELGSRAQAIASAFQQSRMNAIRRQSPTRVLVDVHARRIWTEGSGPLLELSPAHQLSVTSATRERAGPAVAGIRFFPDGSSTGGVVRIESKGRAYEVRIDWLSGRVTQRRTT